MSFNETNLEGVYTKCNKILKQYGIDMIMRSGLHAFCDRSKNKGRIRAWTARAARAARTARTARTHVRLFFRRDYISNFKLISVLLCFN